MKSIQKLLQLAKKTGDRLIVHDPTTDDAFVILDIQSYQEFVDAKNDWDDLEDVVTNIADHNEEPISTKDESQHQVEQPEFSQHHEPVPIPNEPPSLQDIDDQSKPIDFFPEEEVVMPEDNSTTQKEDKKHEQEQKPLINPSDQKTNANTDWFSAGSILKDRYAQDNGAHKDWSAGKKQKNIRRKQSNNKVNPYSEDGTVFLEEPI